MPLMPGTDVRGIRQALGLGVPKFATVLGVHQSTVHRWEAAGSDPVRVDGVPWNVLTALRQRLQENGFDTDEIRATGRNVSDALVVGGALLALGLLIAFATRSAR